MRKIKDEELAYTAQWGYRTMGRGMVVVTSELKQYYVTAEQTHDFFHAHHELAETEVAEETIRCLQTYNPRTHFIVLVTAPEVTLLVGEYATDIGPAPSKKSQPKQRRPWWRKKK
jgi:hypothetical protein